MKKIYLLIITLVIFAAAAKAQSEYVPYNYQFYQKFDRDGLSTKQRTHTSLKPFIMDSVYQKRYDTLMNLGIDTVGKHSWFHRKIFSEHLLEDKTADYTFYADVMGDLRTGRDFSGTRKNIQINTRSFQLGGTIGKNFYFYSSGYEDQATFPTYLNTYVKQTGIVPGMAYDRSFGQTKSDWSYVTALISYTPVKYLNITMGQDKNFIGDGYRSVLLSDYSSPYSFLKLTANLGNVRYMAMYGMMNDPTTPAFTYSDGYRRKWGTFHYLDWAVTKRWNVGFFDAIIWGDKDESGNKRGFDFTYASPIIFLRPVEASNGSPDNALIGFTSKYKLFDGMAVYGQFLLDEFQEAQFFHDLGSSRNKFSYQLGLRGADLFHIKGLNYLAEFNGSRPYTYSETREIISYSNQGEPLAHPFGANFTELVGLLNYSYKRFDFSGELDYGHYGLDVNGLNYGKDIFQPYTTPAKAEGNYIGQGLTTNMYYAEGKVSYIINPKTNFRLEWGVILRNEKNSAFNDQTSLFTFGIRTSFKEITTDISSYKTH